MSMCVSAVKVAQWPQVRVESRATRARNYFYGPSGGLAPAVLRLRYSEVSVFKGAAGMRAPSTALPIGARHIPPPSPSYRTTACLTCSAAHSSRLRMYRAPHPPPPKFLAKRGWGAGCGAGRAGWRAIAAVHSCASAVVVRLQFRMSSSRALHCAGATSATDLLRLLPIAPGPELLHCLLAISYATEPADISRENVAGFLYVKDVEREQQTLVCLAPCNSALPGKLLLASTFKIQEFE